MAAEKTAPTEAKPAAKPLIAYEDFARLDLRTARIVAAKAVPKSKKLLELRIDLGEERTIVAGIGKDYPPEDLVGKTIIVCANLEPTRLMGVESRGMLLAAETADGVALLTTDRPTPAGAGIR
jgi:methionyl-tRNA synthetase